MSADYTPEMVNIRDAWIYGDESGTTTEAERGAQFDRWLATIRREERAQVKSELRAEARLMRQHSSHVSAFIDGIQVAANMALSGSGK